MFNTDKSKEASQNKVSGLMGGLAGVGVGVGSSMLNNALYGSPKYQQQQMQDMQIKGAKELADYNYQKQLDMWKATNFGAQRAEMEKAGLSASLMYGGSGAGGGTTGSGGGGMPTGDTGSAQMMARVQAQAMNADTVLKLATAEKTKAETANISGGVAKGLELDNIAKEFQNNLNKDSKDDQLATIKETARKLTGEANSAGVKGAVDTATQVAQQSQIFSEAVGAYLNNIATMSGVEKNDAEIKKMGEEIAQKWQELKLKGEQVNIERFKAEVMANTPSIDQVVGGKIDNLFNAISELSDITDTNKFRRKVK